MKRKIGITETIFRDAHQSLLATRLKLEDMLEIVELLDEVGFQSFEVWGGATFDSCLRYLNEDPWERLRTFRKRLPKTKLQMLLRGQNLVGYRQYPDDVVDEFVAKSVDNGIDIIRIFDALNDIRNLERAVLAGKKAGASVQGAVVYTVSPVHNIDGYIKLAEELAQLGVDSICIKDMAGILAPEVARQLILGLKKKIDLPIQVHSHYTGGFASMTYWHSIQAGADGIDTALSPLALGTSQPPTESMIAALADTDYDTGLDLQLLAEAVSKFEAILSDNYKRPPISVNTEVLISQMPGGMLSNLRAQLEQQKLGHKYQEILSEVPRVRKEMGYPPLVTPMSQIVGTQSVLNVVTGERYKIKTKEIRDYVKGLYGRPPVAIDKDIQKLLINEKPLTVRPADLLEPGLEKAREEVKDLIKQDEDVLSYILFPEVAKKYFENRGK